MTTSPPRVGVLLPCRDEAAVVERRLANLAALEWPAGVEHRLVVLDDHSCDDTARLARELLTTRPIAGVRAEVVPNLVRPGKNGAIEAGLAALEGEVDLVVLTDADVLVEPGALVALVRAFEREPELGMACGAQAFVHELDPSGSAPSGVARGAGPAAAGWDRWTARARRLESRVGRLFSVHGQWLAWRAALDLRPRPGVAADDVDLRLQVAAGPCPRVRLVGAARFYETKPPPGAAAEAQALRRARAWFQVFDGRRRSPGRGWVDRLQWSAYAQLPGSLPEIVPTGAALILLGAGLALGAWAALVTLGLLAACAATPAGREARRTLRVILQARRLERAQAMPETWEMRRES